MTESEKEFHCSRLMWAFVNNELHWTYSADGHKEWLDETFGTDYNFDEIVRGYIRKENNSDIVNIVAYKGDFEQVTLSNNQIKVLNWLADLNYYYEKIKIYSGVIKGVPGEVWKTKEFVKEVEKSSAGTKLVSYLDLLNYEHFLIQILNKENKYISYNEKREVQKEYRELINVMKCYYINKINTTDNVVRRAYIYNN